jgi:hypothetical protein
MIVRRVSATATAARFLTATCDEAMVLSAQIGVLAVRGGMSSLSEGAAECGTSLSSLPGAALPGTLIFTRT